MLNIPLVSKNINMEVKTLQIGSPPALGMECSENAQAAFPASQDALAEALQMRLEVFYTFPA